MDLLLVAAIFSPLVFSQNPTLSLIYSNVGTGQVWGSSPAFYTKPDGQSIIVFSSYWAIFCVDALTGDSLWEIDIEHNTPPLNLPNRVQAGVVLVTNFRAEGDAAFLVGHNGGHVSIWSPEGELLTIRKIEPLLDDNRPVYSLSAAKIRETDPWRILVGLPTTSLGRWPNTHILDPYLLAVTPAVPVAGSPEGSNSLGVISKNIAAADLDGDGVLEIVVPSDDYSVAVWKMGETLTPSTQFPADETIFYNSEGMWSKVIFSRDYTKEFRGWAGSDGDFKPFFAHGIATVIPVELFADGFAAAGRSEPIVAVSGLYNSFDTDPPEYEYNTVFLLNPDRTRLQHTPTGGGADWDWTLAYDECTTRYAEPWQTIPNVEIQVSYADLTGDGVPEIIFPCSDGRLHAVSLAKSAVSGWPYDLQATPTAIRFASEAAIFEKSGSPMVVFVTWGPYDESPAFFGELIILSHQGQEVTKVTLPEGSGGDTNGGKTAPSLFRFSEGENLYAAVLTRSAGLCLYELENTEDAVILWQSDRGSFERNGALSVPHAFVGPPDLGFTASIVGIVLGSAAGVVLIVAIVVIGIIVLVLGRSAARGGQAKAKKGKGSRKK